MWIYFPKKVSMCLILSKHDIILLLQGWSDFDLSKSVLVSRKSGFTLILVSVIT